MIFNNDYILIDDNGIDLLRNKFAFFHINFSDIDSYNIVDGYLLRNRFVILIFAIGVLFLSLIMFNKQMPMYKDLFDLNVHISGSLKGLVILLLIPPMLLIIGIILIRQAFLKSKIIHIQSRDIIHKIRIREIDKEGKLIDMIKYLDSKIINK